MIQEFNRDKIIATDGEHTIIFDVSEDVYNKYAGNNAREVTKGSDDELVFDKYYSGTKTTYTLKHHLNVLGVPIFFIEKILKEEIKNHKYTVPHITNEVSVTC